MDTKARLALEQKLTDFYARSGANDSATVAVYVKDALQYLAMDREHYIEVREKNAPDIGFPEDYGIVCKMIPLYRETETKRENRYTEETTTVYSVVVAGNTVRFVSGRKVTKFALDPTRNHYGYPDYRYVELEDIPYSTGCVSPRRIRAVATKRDRRCYNMIFMAMNRFCMDRDANTVAHKTERAMMVMGRTPLNTLKIGTEKIPGLLVPLATGDSREELREDCRYTRRDELCLFVDVYGPQYVMKTRHNYAYFRKVVCDDVSGGCIYEPTEGKQEFTYEYIELEKTPEKMYALYF